MIGHIEVEDTPMKEEGHQMKEGIPTETEDLQEEDHKMMGDPQIDMEDTLVEEDHLMMEGHLMEMEDHQDALIEEDPQDLEDLLDQ